MNIVRTPAVSGSFYPEEAEALQKMLKTFMQQTLVSIVPVPKAVIVPHAGYIYSGLSAAHLYTQLIPARQTIKKVVLMGPSHHVSFKGIAGTHMTHFATPLGNIAVDQSALYEISTLAQISIIEQAHAQEHSLEVQLPFLQEILEDFSIIPLVVGEASAEQVSLVLDKLWGGQETLIVISSDLSHYLDYKTAQVMDQQTTDAIENLRPEDIHYQHACGRVPINGLLHLARSKKMKVTTVDLRNSGDTAGSKNQVVGYGAYAFNE